LLPMNPAIRPNRIQPMMDINVPPLALTWPRGVQTVSARRCPRVGDLLRASADCASGEARGG
jgi:hypothetical protein